MEGRKGTDMTYRHSFHGFLSILCTTSTAVRDGRGPNSRRLLGTSQFFKKMTQSLKLPGTHLGWDKE